MLPSTTASPPLEACETTTLEPPTAIVVCKGRGASVDVGSYENRVVLGCSTDDDPGVDAAGVVAAAVDCAEVRMERALVVPGAAALGCVDCTAVLLGSAVSAGSVGSLWVELVDEACPIAEMRPLIASLVAAALLGCVDCTFVLLGSAGSAGSVDSLSAEVVDVVCPIAEMSPLIASLVAAALLRTVDTLLSADVGSSVDAATSLELLWPPVYPLGACAAGEDDDAELVSAAWTVELPELE